MINNSFMHNPLSRFSKKKRKIVLGTASGVLIAMLLFGSCFGSGKPKYQTERIVYGEVTEMVRVTGQVQSKAIYDLRFEQDGSVDEIFVDVGDDVTKLQELALLDSTSQELLVQEAQANVDFFQAQLARIEAGSTTEEIRIAQKNLDAAVEQVKFLNVQLENTKLLQREALQGQLVKVNTSEVTVESLRSELESLENQLAQEIADAQVRYDNALNALEDVSEKVRTERATTTQDIENAVEELVLRMDASLISMRDALDSVDNYLGYSDNSSDDSIEGIFSILNIQAKNDAKIDYLKAESLFEGLEDIMDNLSVSDSLSDVADDVEKFEDTLLAVKEVLLAMRYAFEKSITDATNTQEVLSGYKREMSSFITTIDERLSLVRNAYQLYRDSLLVDVSTGSSGNSEESQRVYEVDASKQNLENVQTNAILTRRQLETRLRDAESLILDAKQNYDQVEAEWFTKIRELEKSIENAKGDVETRQAELDQKEAGPRTVDLAPYEAELAQAKVQLQKSRDELEEMTLIAPVEGVITKIFYEIGERITPQDIFLVMQASEKEIIVDVSETDIARVFLEAPVMMTFDAFSFTDQFFGIVTEIEPAETIIDGVTYYRVTVLLNEDYPRIKSGMTANMEIISGSELDALLVPALAVRYEGSRTYVEVLKDGEVEERDIEIGLEGDLYYEVVSGLEENEEVITFEL